MHEGDMVNYEEYLAAALATYYKLFKEELCYSVHGYDPRYLIIDFHKKDENGRPVRHSLLEALITREDYELFFRKGDQNAITE